MPKTLSQPQIEALLKKRKLENLESIAEIEQFLKQKRGYVFKMPQPGEEVIILFSGGLDSTCLAAMLMEEYGLKLRPIFTLRQHKYQQPELKSLEFWTRYFQQRYPGQFFDPMKVTASFPPLEIRGAYEKVENQRVKKRSPQIWGDYFYSNLLCINAAQYAYYLQIAEQKRIRNIFCAFMPVDGTGKSDMTLTSLRGTMLGMCTVTNDFSWQVTSIPLEKEIGFFFDKEYFIKWAYQHNIPLEKTRSSCQSPADMHCGECLLCQIRQWGFRKARVPDLTEYRSNRLEYRAIRKLKRLAKQFFTNITAKS